MGKLIVNEQDVKRIIDESTTTETGIINKEIKAEVNRLHLDLDNYRNKSDEDNIKINNVIENLLKRISILEKQKKDESEINVANNTELSKSQSDDILDIRTLCRELNISGFGTTNVKYYLFEHGIYNMKINECKNSYSIKPKFDKNADKELVGYIHINKKKITFSRKIIDYFRRNETLVKESICRYDKKNKEYKIAKKNVSTKMVQNYREEIKRICGLNSPEKWIPLYNEFSKTFPNFYKDFEKAKKEYREKHPTVEHDLTKIAYIVEDMQQGDVLLKIACQLYVD